MEQSIDEKAPQWIPKALEALGGVALKAYESLEDNESMPSCFGAISPEPSADDGFAWGLLRIPEELDKYQAYDYFRGGLAALLRTERERTILGGFSITEGWELDPKTNERTGREVLILNIESPDGWRATKMFQIVREDGLVSLEPEIVLVQFHFPGEADGNMQGMFPVPPLSSLQ